VRDVRYAEQHFAKLLIDHGDLLIQRLYPVGNAFHLFKQRRNVSARLFYLGHFL
jgi:hypothetical protein